MTNSLLSYVLFALSYNLISDFTTSEFVNVLQDCSEYMCSVCTDAHKNTRLTKSHRVEPVPDPIYNHPLKAGATRTPSVVVVVVNYVIIVAIGQWTWVVKEVLAYGECK